MHPHVSPWQLLFRLTTYFSVLVAIGMLVGFAYPEVVRLLPIGGHDALDIAQLDSATSTLSVPTGEEITTSRLREAANSEQSTMILLLLSISLSMSVVIMLPITWTYAATRQESGFPKSFVRALIVLPVCATTIVLLIQDSLALAFGLAALVAAVRFRVSLKDPIDAIYIFSAICVGLAAGIGFLGIAALMAVFFCYANAILWLLDYGRNALDDAEATKHRRKLEKSAE